MFLRVKLMANRSRLHKVSHQLLGTRALSVFFTIEMFNISNRFVPFSFKVMVIDNGNPTLSSSTRVVVKVDDVNDNAPEFLERFYKIQIPSTIVAQPESAVLQVN